MENCTGLQRLNRLMLCRDHLVTCPGEEGDRTSEGTRPGKCQISGMDRILDPAGMR